MTPRQNRFALYASAMVAAMLGFAIAEALASRPLQLLAVTAAVLLLVAYLIGCDEVERALALRASSFAYFATLLGLIAIPLLAPTMAVAGWLEHAWAVSMASWLLGWVLFRTRLG
jgi:hypothetical protein